jgi:hypothetical protein
MTDWGPATDAEAAMRDALAANDQELYFRVLSRSELLLPVSAEALAGNAPMGWGTWTTGARTHVLAFTSPDSLYRCLNEPGGSYRVTAFHRLAADWPNYEWWLAVNPGLPIEAYLPSWFVSQLTRGEVRLPGRTMGARARIAQGDLAAALNGRVRASGPTAMSTPIRTHVAAVAPPGVETVEAEIVDYPPVSASARVYAAAPVTPSRPPADPGYLEGTFYDAPSPGLDQRGSTYTATAYAGSRPDFGGTQEYGAGEYGAREYGGGEYGGGEYGAGQAYGGREYGSRPAAPPDYTVPAYGSTPGLTAPTGYAPQTTSEFLAEMGGYGAALSAALSQPTYAPPEPPPTPAYAEPLYAEPVYAEPVYAEPVYAEPVYSDPVEPAYADLRPAYAQPDSPAYPPTGIAEPEFVDLEATSRISSPVRDLQDAEIVPPPGAWASDFAPANETEANLLSAAEENNTDQFLSTLLLARVIVPVPPGTSASIRPRDPSFPWQIESADGQRFIAVFTSPERLEEHTLSRFTHTVSLRFVQLIAAWPDEELSFAINPGSPVGATLPGSQIIALASWATEVGLRDEPSGDVVVAAKKNEATPFVGVAGAPAAGADRATVMQRTVPHGQVQFYLERGYDRVSGFVNRAHEVAHLTTPRALYKALGLVYSASAFADDDAEVHVVRWVAHRSDLYRLPYGGQHEAGMRAMQGWVIERPPFRGNGFAPGETDVVSEFKVDSVRLPHGAQMWRLAKDGSETLVATYDADTTRWVSGALRA